MMTDGVCEVDGHVNCQREKHNKNVEEINFNMKKQFVMMRNLRSVCKFIV